MDDYKAPLTHYKRIIQAMTSSGPVYDHDLMEQVLEAVAQFTQSSLLESNSDAALVYDAENKTVKVPESYHKAYQILSENGYASLALSADYGGGGASWVLHHLVSEMLAAGNLSLSTCPMLTNGALEALIKNAAESILEQYADQLIRGEYAATMCLTEPQCGTDLGLITTKAQPKDDYYEITGQKIWITFGEHDLVENIIHLVLARTPDAPKGSKGISMFVVPKILPDGTPNHLGCIGVEKKMGQHGSPTAMMSFEGAKGWLVGDECKGMRMMFEMMNPARIGVGVQALGLSEAAYQTALSFASTRRQSRAIDSALQDKNESADIILVHPDVRRMLMHVASTNAAMRWMVAYCGQALDRGDEAFVGLLTPIIKSYASEQSVANISQCMQVMGGMGYVQDGRCEQYYRDGRITMIYEGTNGIQALDLVGRKVAKDLGKTMLKLLKALKEMPVENGDAKLKSNVLGQLSEANTYLLKQSMRPLNVAAAAPQYLNLFAIAIQYSLLCQYESDQDLIRFYGDYIVPEAGLYLERLKMGAGVMMDYEPLNDLLKKP